VTGLRLNFKELVLWYVCVCVYWYSEITTEFWGQDLSKKQELCISSGTDLSSWQWNCVPRQLPLQQLSCGFTLGSSDYWLWSPWVQRCVNIFLINICIYIYPARIVEIKTHVCKNSYFNSCAVMIICVRMEGINLLCHDGIQLWFCAINYPNWLYHSYATSPLQCSHLLSHIWNGNFYTLHVNISQN
jgi:hypothetical protein